MFDEAYERIQLVYLDVQDTRSAKQTLRMAEFSQKLLDTKMSPRCDEDYDRRIFARALIAKMYELSALRNDPMMALMLWTGRYNDAVLESYWTLDL